MIYTQLQGINKQPSRFGLDKYNFYNHCISKFITDVDWDGDIWRASHLSLPLPKCILYTLKFIFNNKKNIKKNQTKEKIKNRFKKDEKYVVSLHSDAMPLITSPSPNHKSWTRQRLESVILSVIDDCQIKMSNDTTYCIHNSFFYLWENVSISFKYHTINQSIRLSFSNTTTIYLRN